DLLKDGHAPVSGGPPADRPPRMRGGPLNSAAPDGAVDRGGRSMSPAAHGTVGFRASPRLYRGKVVMLALAVAVVALAEALRTEVREEVARPAEPEGVERMVLDGADTVIAAEA